MSYDLALLPALPEGTPPRKLYVRCLELAVMGNLRTLGYEPIDLFTLPRTTPDENIDYLRAKAQALEEGTVQFDKEERMALELEMKAAGLLDANKPDGPTLVITEGVLDALNWGDSSHTLRENSTVQLVPKKVPNAG